MIIAMVYVIRILNDMKRISKTMLKESDKFANDIDSLREAVKSEGAKAKTIANFFSNYSLIVAKIIQRTWK